MFIFNYWNKLKTLFIRGERKTNQFADASQFPLKQFWIDSANIRINSELFSPCISTKVLLCARDIHILHDANYTQNPHKPIKYINVHNVSWLCELQGQSQASLHSFKAFSNTENTFCLLFVMCFFVSLCLICFKATYAISILIIFLFLKRNLIISNLIKFHK